MLHPVRAALFLALAACLAACSREEREPDIRACIAQAQHPQPDYSIPANESAEEKHDRIGGLVSACMQQRGYRHDDRSMADSRCVDDVDYNPYCYVKIR